MGACDVAAVGGYSAIPQHVAQATARTREIMQAGNDIATGLKIKTNEDSAHSAASELSSLGIGRRDLDSLRSADLELTSPYCYAPTRNLDMAALLLSCREDIKKLRYDSTGPVLSALWKQATSNYETMDSKFVEMKSDHCALGPRLYEDGIGYLLESLMKRSARELVQMLSEDCLSGSHRGGMVVVAESDLETPLLAFTHNPGGPRGHQSSNLKHTPVSGNLAVLERLCSNDPPKGYISKRTKKICNSFYNGIMGGCSIAAVALYATHHESSALIASGVAGSMALGKGNFSGLAIPGKADSADAKAGSNIFKHRSSKAKTEEADLFEKMEKGPKKLRSIESGRPKTLLNTNL